MKSFTAVVALVTAITTGGMAGPRAPRAIIASDSDPVIVDIDRIAFQTDTVHVAVGQTIRWVNREGVPHTVVSGTVTQSRRSTTVRPDGLFNSEFLTKDDVFEFTPTEPGTIPYYCSLHPFMTAVIVVE